MGESGYIVPSDSYPKCEIRGCELQSKFAGFGHFFCWNHYSNWMRGLFAHSSPNHGMDSQPQQSLVFDAEGIQCR